MIGLIIGIISGAIQFLLLAKFSTLLTTKQLSGKTVLLGVLQFIVPFIVLIAVAVFIRQDLLYAGLGIVGSLLLGAIVKLIITMLNSRGHGKKNG